MGWRKTKTVLSIAVIALSTGCVSAMYLQQNLTKADALRPGMSTAEAKQIMGPPAKSEFDHGVEEWHYCKTASSFFGGDAVDEFVALFFKDDTLIATRNYSVSSKEMGFYGSCDKAVKHGDYRVPDQVLELRLK